MLSAQKKLFVKRSCSSSSGGGGGGGRSSSNSSRNVPLVGVEMSGQEKGDAHEPRVGVVGDECQVVRTVHIISPAVDASCRHRQAWRHHLLRQCQLPTTVRVPVQAHWLFT